MKIRNLILVFLLFLITPISIQALTVGDCNVLITVKKNSVLDADSYICKDKKYGESNESVYYSGEGNKIVLNNFNGYYLANNNAYDVNIEIIGNNNISLLHIDDKVKVTVTGEGSLKFKEVSFVKKVLNGENINNYSYNGNMVVDSNNNIFEGTLADFENSYDLLKTFNKIPSEFNKDDYVIDLVNDYSKMTPVVINDTWFAKNVVTDLKTEIVDGYGKIEYVKQEQKNEELPKVEEIPKKVNKKNQLEAEKVILISKEKVNSKYKLEVNNLKEKDIAKKVDDLLDDRSLIDFYDISVFNGSKEVSMKNGEYTIKIKLDEDINEYENFQVIYVSSDGEIKEYIDAVIEDGYLIFHTTHLSQYGIVAKPIVETIDVSEVEEKKSNYSLIIKISILVIIVLLFSIFIIFLIVKSNLLKKKKRKKNKKMNIFLKLRRVH